MNEIWINGGNLLETFTHYLSKTSVGK